MSTFFQYLYFNFQINKSQDFDCQIKIIVYNKYINSITKLKNTMTNNQIKLQLNKYIAHAGLCSRRKADEFILNGDISVNGQIITNKAYRVLETDKISYKSKEIRLEDKIYILLNKPTGYITTVSDERNRKTVIDLIKPKIEGRLYPIGRLDRATTGLIILTNDGNMAQSLSHPRYNVQKMYTATLDRPLLGKDLEAIKNGLKLEDGFIKVDGINYMHENRACIKLELHSGKNHIIRRIFKHLSYTVIKLDRNYYAGLTKKNLPVGAWRPLTQKEIESLMVTTT